VVVASVPYHLEERERASDEDRDVTPQFAGGFDKGVIA
jgi:hypothetical protein